MRLVISMHAIRINGATGAPAMFPNRDRRPVHQHAMIRKVSVDVVGLSGWFRQYSTMAPSIMLKS